MGGAAGLVSDMMNLQAFGDQRGRDQIDALAKQTRIKGLAEKVMALPEKTPEKVMELGRQYNVSPDEAKEIFGLLKGFVDYSDTMHDQTRRGVTEGREDTQWQDSRVDRQQSLSDAGITRQREAEDRKRLTDVGWQREDTQWQDSQADRQHLLGRRQTTEKLSDQKTLADINESGARADYYKTGRTGVAQARPYDESLNKAQKAQVDFLTKQYQSLSNQLSEAWDEEEAARIQEQMDTIETKIMGISSGGGEVGSPGAGQPPPPADMIKNDISKWINQGAKARQLKKTVTDQKTGSW